MLEEYGNGMVPYSVDKSAGVNEVIEWLYANPELVSAIGIALLGLLLRVIFMMWRRTKVRRQREKMDNEKEAQPNGRKHVPGVDTLAWLAEEAKYWKNEYNKANERDASETALVKEWLYWTIVVLTASLLVGLLWAIWHIVPSDGTLFDLQFNPQIYLYIPVLVYFLASFRQVDTERVAGAAFFGSPVYQFDPGLKWVPRLLLEFRTDLATFAQGQFPGDANKIFWDDDNKELPPGAVRAARILFSEGKDHDTNLYQKRMTAGVVWFAKIRLVKERFYKFIRNVSPIDEINETFIRAAVTGGMVSKEILEVFRHLNDTGIKVIGEMAAGLSVDEMRMYRGLVNEILTYRLQLLLLQWGVKLEEAGISDINTGHTLNKQAQERSNAQIYRDAEIDRGIGDAEREKRLGAAVAANRLALLKAEGEGLKNIMETTGIKDGAVPMAAEVAKQLAASGNIIMVGGGGLEQLLGLIAAGKKVGERNDKPSES